MTYGKGLNRWDCLEVFKRAVEVFMDLVVGGKIQFVYETFPEISGLKLTRTLRV